MNTVALKAVKDVNADDFKKIIANHKDISSTAMELTDAWGAMFYMDEDSLKNIAIVLGFSEEIYTNIYANARNLSYVVERGSHGISDIPIFTWHGADSLILSLRGVVGLRSAMANVTDDNFESYITDNFELFTKVKGVLPSYSRYHMFSPEVASRVLSTFGAIINPIVIFDIARNYGANVTEDLEGRKGVSTQFIRSATLTISAIV